MAKVFVHTREQGEMEWVNDYYPFSRVPVEGEYFTLSSDGEWFLVELVVHTPFDKEVHAEVFAVQVDHLEVMKSKLK